MTDQASTGKTIGIMVGHGIGDQQRQDDEAVMIGGSR